MSMGTEKLKYQVILEEWIKSREWEDELDVDLDHGLTQLSTQLNIDGQVGRLYIECYDKTDLVDVFIYFGLDCKDTRRTELCILFNEINQNMLYGKMVLLASGKMRWHHRVDFEGSQPSAASIEQIAGPGWSIASKYAALIATVTLTETAAGEAMESYLKTQEELQEND